MTTPDVLPASSATTQLSFPGLCPITEAVEALAVAGIEERGAIFTRREVVDFILDLVGYTDDKPLHHMRIMEPSFGDGDFLLPVIDRLLTAWRNSPECNNPIADLIDSVCGVELHQATFHRTRQTVIARLISRGINSADAEVLADTWLIRADFLLLEQQGSFHFAVGNPPYVRQELIPDILMAEYRARYETVYDRADLYIPFIERSLTLLSEGGHLGFICADRWMKNRYGGPLRQLVTERFHLKTYVDMVDTPAFHSDVIAYPAITIIAREISGATRIAHRPQITAQTLSSLANMITADALPASNVSVREIEGIAVGAEPWILGSFDQLAAVRRLEAVFPTLEEADCNVGIGVATGADRAFIGAYDSLDVEADRKLPLVTTRDIVTGTVEWRGLGVINPFGDDGRLVNLRRHPRLQRYLEARKDQIAKRHVALKSPANWYRTIDRIYPELVSKPKLLIPDIKGEAHIVYEDGRLYPHHNLYFITSSEWDLRALQAVLLSGIARLFISIYSTRMRGGYLRFQAQYLRRIRVPHWHEVSDAVKDELILAAERGDTGACNEAVFKLYGLNAEERTAIGGNGI